MTLLKRSRKSVNSKIQQLQTHTFDFQAKYWKQADLGRALKVQVGNHDARWAMASLKICYKNQLGMSIFLKRLLEYLSIQFLTGTQVLKLAL